MNTSWIVNAALHKERFFLLLTLLFVLLFPKSGIKISSIPITFGYMLLLMGGFILLFKKHLLISPTRLYFWLFTLPFFLVGLLHFVLFGSIETGHVLSFFVHFLLLPFLFFWVFAPILDRHIDFLFIHIRWMLPALAIYGLFVFFFWIYQGFVFEIPLLTVNLQDIGTLSTDKCNARGGLLKLFSTYNNGNLYGVVLFMLLPLYEFLEKRVLLKLLVKASLILTLSRTIWFGLFFYECVHLIWFKKNKTPYFIGLGLLFIGAIWALSELCAAYQIPFTMDFLFDLTFGDHLPERFSLENIRLLSMQPFFVVREAVYLGVLESFGFLGLLSYLCLVLAPVIYFFSSPTTQRQNPHFKSIFFGIVMYLFVSLSDGCMSLIPVFCIYWLLETLLTSPKFASKSQIAF